MIGEPSVPLLPLPWLRQLSKLHNFHLTFLEALLCDIAQSRHRKSLEKTLFCLSLHLQF